jgi:predicted MFS family arabinose efflux permease
VCAAAGVGAGYPISGLIADTLGLSAAFWFGTLVSGVALLAAFAVLPSSSHRPSAKLDVLGALLLTFGLGALLLAVAQGNTWHWTSARICGLLALCAAAFASWIYQQLHKSAPLVELRLLRHRVVLTSDGCAVVLGVAMYMYISAVTEFVQTSRSVGYGFSASIVVAGFCLVPFSIFSFAASRTLPWCTELVGERALLPFGSLIVAAPGAFLALFHTSLWEAFVAMGMLGIGVGLTYAAIPGMIVSAVPESETGSAMGFYQVVRYVGFSFGSALTASVLSGHTSAGRHLPNESGFTLVFWIACGICLLAATIAWILPHRGTPTVREVLLGEEDAELAGAGLVGLTQR